MIDHSAIPDYLAVMKLQNLPRNFIPTQLLPPEFTQAHHDKENERLR